MPNAAHLGDPIEHTNAFAGMLLLGVGAAIFAAATIASGGLTLVAAATVAGAAVTGAGVGQVLGSMSWAGTTPSGNILTGSFNVMVNGQPSARASLDSFSCSYPFHGSGLIAQGSSTVYINSMPASRIGDSTTCSAKLAVGSSNIIIGGPTETTEKISGEIPSWLNWVLAGVGLAAAIVLAGPVVAVLGFTGAVFGGIGGQWLGGEIFGEGSDGQKVMMLLGSVLGGSLAVGTARVPAGWLGDRLGGPLGAFTRGGVPGWQEATINAKSAASVADKLNRYLLNDEHPKGSSKAQWFRKALGFTRENSDNLGKQLVFKKAEAIETDTTEFGTKFEQTIKVVGANGRTVPVKTVWIVGSDGVPKLITSVPGD